MAKIVIPGAGSGDSGKSLVSGDDRITELVRAHFAFVWRVLRRLGLSEADADDAAQRVMITVARRLPDVAEGSERAFLFRTAWFVAQKEHRSRRRRPEQPDPESDAHVDSSPNPEQLLLERRSREKLDSILECLPLDLRAAFVCFEIEGLDKNEVAAALGIPVGTAASRLRRAREEFARQARRLGLYRSSKGAIA
jgi:RNA polymerase sigma-70 factor (ECF subfamily)